MTRTTVLLSCLALSACGPSSEPDKSGGADAAEPGTPDGGGGGGDGTAIMRGTVWAPGNAPGMVPAGHEVPVSGAVVYVSSSRPGPIPAGAYCDECTEAPLGSGITDELGRFEMRNIFPGTYWLIVEKAQFRLETEVSIGPNETIDLPDELATLPSIHDPDNGKWIPRIALASGLFDDMQDIMGKMGMGEVSNDGAFVPASAAGRFDVYSNGGSIDGVASESLADLVGDLNKMLDYHIIFIPCSGSTNNAALDDVNVLRNIRDYVAAGGKLYVTDWSGEWADNVFPAQIEFDASDDTPASAYDATSDTWDTSQFGDADGTPSYTSEHAKAVDGDLAGWLGAQTGPGIDGTIIDFDATDFQIEGNYNHIEGLMSVQVDTDDEGNPVMDVPKPWIIGEDTPGGPQKPLTVTFEPAGCGRVLYSTYHTTANTHQGLAPQERVLLYLVMEIGICKEGPVID